MSSSVSTVKEIDNTPHGWRVQQHITFQPSITGRDCAEPSTSETSSPEQSSVSRQFNGLQFVVDSEVLDNAPIVTAK